MFKDNISNLQKRVGEWQNANFDPPNLDPKQQKLLQLALGANEEAGELAHAVLKFTQGIRGDSNKHFDDAKDAIGDIVIYLMNFCNELDWDFHSIIQETTDFVVKRNWKTSPEKGTSLPDAGTRNIKKPVSTSVTTE